MKSQWKERLLFSTWGTKDKRLQLPHAIAMHDLSQANGKWHSVCFAAKTAIYVRGRGPVRRCSYRRIKRISNIYFTPLLLVNANTDVTLFLCKFEWLKMFEISHTTSVMYKFCDFLLQKTFKSFYTVNFDYFSSYSVLSSFF